jgi:hypothetical protein
VLALLVVEKAANSRGPHIQAQNEFLLLKH